MLFKNKEDKNKKEFIQYKDGKVVTVEVEKTRKPQGDDEIPLYQEMKEDKPKAKVKDELKKIFTIKRLKFIGFIIVIIFFVFTMKDIYQAFFTPSEEAPIEQKEESSQKEPVNNEKQPKEDTKPTTSTKPVVKETKEKSGKKEESPSVNDLKHPLETANLINNLILSQSNEEIQFIGNYVERKANKIGLQNHLSKSLKEKESAYAYLSMKQDSFNTPSLKLLYKDTENRLLESILFTKEAVNGIQLGKGREFLSAQANNYMVADQQIREKQVDSLMKVLKEHDVQYELDETTKAVEYSLN